MCKDSIDLHTFKECDKEAKIGRENCEAFFYNTCVMLINNNFNKRTTNKISHAKHSKKEAKSLALSNSEDKSVMVDTKEINFLKAVTTFIIK